MGRAVFYLGGNDDHDASLLITYISYPPVEASSSAVPWRVPRLPIFWFLAYSRRVTRS